MANAEDNTVQVTEGDTHDFGSLLSSTDRDFLIRNNGDHVSFLSYVVCFHFLCVFSRGRSGFWVWERF